MFMSNHTSRVPFCLLFRLAAGGMGGGGGDLPFVAGKTHVYINREREREREREGDFLLP